MSLLAMLQANPRFVSATNSVFGDVDGDSAADFQIILTGVASLVVTDFIM